MAAPTLPELFWSFLRIGAMGFGGPFALISLQEKVIVQKGWLTSAEFTESVGMGSMAPGPISSNASAVVGYRLRGLPGAAVSYFAFHLPAVALVIVLSAYFEQVESLHAVQGALKGVFAAVVGLLVAVALKTGRNLIKDYKSAVVALLPFLALVLLKLNPVLIVLSTGLIGYFAFRSKGGKA